jgi:aryl-alcohol dehydrogenase-like predicted oxidoreductase
MALRSLGTTGLQIPRLVFGGNVFGWTVDEKQSFSLLDALLERGFTLSTPRTFTLRGRRKQRR